MADTSQSSGAALARVDGRSPADLRPVQVEMDPLRFAEGSCLIRWGNNQVLCAATVEPVVPRWLAGQGRGWVTAEYAMLPRSSRQRIVRDTNRNQPNSRALEIQRLIGRSLRAVVDLNAFGERAILIDCDVIEADGGTRTACVTGGFIALARALTRMREAGQLGKNPILKDYLAAVSVGMVEGRPVLDLNYLEDSQAETDMNVVMTAGGRFVELQGTAESHPFSAEELTAMLGMAQAGLQPLFARQRELFQVLP